MTRPFIMVAPNGARRGPSDHPALPVTIDETVATAIACQRAGADALHLHVRDDEGRHTLDAGRYRETLAELRRSVPGMQVQITTESAGIFTVRDQLACLASVKPDWASVSLREISRAPELAERVYKTCEENGTIVQHILYDKADARLLREWQRHGTISADPASVILVLGRYGAGEPSAVGNLRPFLEVLPPVKDWMLCAFGQTEHACLVEAARLGGACRVGFENSLTDDTGTPWPDNASSVRSLRNKIETLARRVA